MYTQLNKSSTRPETSPSILPNAAETTDSLNSIQATEGEDSVSSEPLVKPKPQEVEDSISSEPLVNPKLQLEIIAKEQCWIAIDIDGIRAAWKLMKPGETEELNAMERINALFGNAGGIEMKINGMPAKKT